MAGALSGSTLAEPRFNSSNPSFQFVGNWLMNSQRAARRSRPVLICQRRHLAREHSRLATGVTVWERRILDLSPFLRGIGTIFKHQDVRVLVKSMICESATPILPWSEPSEGLHEANRRRFLTRLGQQHSYIVEIARRNGDFQRNYGRALGALLYLRSLSAARGRPTIWRGLAFGLIAAAFPGL